MKRIRFKNKYKHTVNYMIFIVCFLIIFFSIILFIIYGNKTSKYIVELTNQKTDKIIYLFFSDLITDKVVNKKTVGDILKITRNNRDEILTVQYDMEKTYKILTDVSIILKKAISNLENGKIDINTGDDYLVSNKGLILNVPFFINSRNVFLNNIGPRIPVLINLNENLLTNLKTKVTNYGFNNALLEVYITVQMQKLIITPIKKYNKVFNYDILISALVVNGSVPEFYGGNYESNSNLLDVPLD